VDLSAGLQLIEQGRLQHRLRRPRRRRRQGRGRRSAVVACIGDGSWMSGNPQVTAWASAAFHKAPVLFIVWNNRGYRTGTNEVLRTYPEGYAAKQQDLAGGWFGPCPNYSGEAASSGAYGEKVTDPREVAPAIRRAVEAMRRDGVPAVLDMWMPKLVTNEV